ncbi:hypothetical protein GCM10023213_27660 [Prosthecobacter algae]|uniref:Uncharacterized protein n=1 Tax=Prosthecobacter algae TaxID=1144682 RepID=A0ABP9P7S6_9BACT
MWALEEVETWGQAEFKATGLGKSRSLGGVGKFADVRAFAGPPAGAGSYSPPGRGALEEAWGQAEFKATGLGKSRSLGARGSSRT